MSRSMLMVMTALSLVSCSSERKWQWTEEVTVAPGEIVQVVSAVRGTSRTPIGGPSESFTVGATLQILGQVPAAPLWADDRDPLFLTRDPETHEFVLVASTVDGRVWSKHDKPMNPYWMFRLRDNQWREEPMAEFVFGNATNLVMFPDMAAEQEGVITAVQKETWLRSRNLVESYRRIEKSYRAGIN